MKTLWVFPTYLPASSFSFQFLRCLLMIPVSPELRRIGGTCVNVLMIICKMCMLPAEPPLAWRLYCHLYRIVVCIGGKCFFPFFIFCIWEIQKVHTLAFSYLLNVTERTRVRQSWIASCLVQLACRKKFTEEGKKVTLSYYVIKMCTRLEFRTLVCTTTCRTKAPTNGVIGFNVMYVNTYQIYNWC